MFPNYAKRQNFSYFVFEDLDKDRKTFSNISKEDFISTYEVSDNMLQNFNDYLNERTRYKITFVAYNDEIKLYLKAILAEQLYGSQAYSKVLNSNDAMLTRVREIIKSNSEILPKIR